MKILGIIPARADSKGIKNKNIKEIAGKPLIAWSIQEALKSKHIDEILVSTNSQKIAKISADYGAKVPYLRPEELALDHVGNEPVVNDILKKIAEHRGIFPEYVIYLPPTSPLRTSNDIDEAIELILNRKEFDSLVSVSPCTEHPYWTKSLDPALYIEDFIFLPPSEKKLYFRRQNLPKAFSLNGAIFLSKAQEIYKSGSFYSGSVGGFVMSKERSVDINDEFDFKIAEFLLKEKINEDR